jgi:hypothetical protein
LSLSGSYPQFLPNSRKKTFNGNRFVIPFNFVKITGDERFQIVGFNAKRFNHGLETCPFKAAFIDIIGQSLERFGFPIIFIIIIPEL